MASLKNRSLAIHFAHDNVDAAENHHYVSNSVAEAKILKHG